jgi:hypothetical protein
MGTYYYARLIQKDEEFIEKANESIEKAGHKTETHNSVKYGFFITKSQIKEEARFMNEDEEGLKQMPGTKRPITTEFLEDFFWNEIGCGVIKISGCDEECQAEVDIITNWLQSEEGEEFIDWENSNNLPQSYSELKVEKLDNYLRNSYDYQDLVDKFDYLMYRMNAVSLKDFFYACAGKSSLAKIISETDPISFNQLIQEI